MRRDGSEQYDRKLDWRFQRVHVLEGIDCGAPDEHLMVFGSRVHTFYHLNRHAYKTGRYGIVHLKKEISRG